MLEQKSYTQLDVLRPAQALDWLKPTKLKALTPQVCQMVF